MKNFYFKFTGLLFKYVCVKAKDLAKARKYVEQFRDDGIYMDSSKGVITFDEYHGRKFEEIESKNLDCHSQTVYAIGKFVDGTEQEHYNRKMNHKWMLQFPPFYKIPGINKAQIYELSPGQFSLTVKSTKELAEYLASIITNVPKDQLIKQVKAHKGPFPLFVYRIKDKQKPKHTIGYRNQNNA